MKKNGNLNWYKYNWSKKYKNYVKQINLNKRTHLIGWYYIVIILGERNWNGELNLKFDHGKRKFVINNNSIT
jgi:hypothetical protein